MKYLDVTTGAPVAPKKVVSGNAVGTTIAETAISVNDYILVGDEMQYLTINRDPDSNHLYFYYEPWTPPATVCYTVQYIDRATGLAVCPDKIVTDVEPGTHVVEYPEAVKDYKPMQSKYEWDVVGNEVKIFIYYYYNDEPILRLSFPGPADPVDPVELVNPADPADSAEPAEPAYSVEPSDSAEPAEPAYSVEPSDSAESVEPAEP